METVEAVANSTEVTGITISERIASDTTGGGDDSPMLVPAITKKMVSFDEEDEDELYALNSEIASGDELDRIIPDSPPPTITAPKATTKFEQLDSNTSGYNGTLCNSTLNNDTYTQSQRHNGIDYKSKITKSASENGISQSLIERRSLYTLCNNGKPNNNCSSSSGEISRRSSESKASTGAPKKNGVFDLKGDNTSNARVSSDESISAPGR